MTKIAITFDLPTTSTNTDDLKTAIDDIVIAMAKASWNNTQDSIQKMYDTGELDESGNQITLEYLADVKDLVAKSLAILNSATVSVESNSAN
jgi:hypothetical protein